jgi:hypothetical protein
VKSQKTKTKFQRNLNEQTAESSNSERICEVFFF